MNTAIIRVSSIVYFVSLSLYFWLSLNPSNDIDPMVTNYLQWWYSVPLTNFEFWLTKVSMVVMLVSLIFSICLLFLKRWAAIGFLVSVTFLAVAEMLLPNYFPQSTLEASFDAFSIMAYVSVLVIFALESKLKTFKA
jgi:hypothetical protein